MAATLKSSVIYSNPDTLGGTPVFKGTRVPVTILFDYLREGSLDEFLDGYPQVTKEMVETVLKLAAVHFSRKSKKNLHENLHRRTTQPALERRTARV